MTFFRAWVSFSIFIFFFNFLFFVFPFWEVNIKLLQLAGVLVVSPLLPHSVHLLSFY